MVININLPHILYRF